jgi:hypothetical protein
VAKQNNNPIKDEWVIRLIDASKDVVIGYEKYLLDEIDYTDLAHLMLQLKEVLPKGCIDENENKKD